jgi:hypothetical protein
MTHDDSARLAPAALQLLRAIVLELDFDEAEGHPPGGVLAELRDKARRLIKSAERRGAIKAAKP